MNDAQKSKLLLSVFLDFSLIIMFLSIIIGSVFIGKLILFPIPDEEGRLLIRTEVMPEEYKSHLSVGDTVFDTLTKRRVGRIQSIETRESEGGVCFILTLDSAFTPRGKSLRTRNLWFYFVVDEI